MVTRTRLKREKTICINIEDIFIDDVITMMQAAQNLLKNNKAENIRIRSYGRGRNETIDICGLIDETDEQMNDRIAYEESLRMHRYDDYVELKKEFEPDPVPMPE